MGRLVKFWNKYLIFSFLFFKTLLKFRSHHAKFFPVNNFFAKRLVLRKQNSWKYRSSIFGTKTNIINHFSCLNFMGPGLQMYLAWDGTCIPTTDSLLCVSGNYGIFEALMQSVSVFKLRKLHILHFFKLCLV